MLKKVLIAILLIHAFVFPVLSLCIDRMNSKDDIVQTNRVNSIDLKTYQSPLNNPKYAFKMEYEYVDVKAYLNEKDKEQEQREKEEKEAEQAALMYSINHPLEWVVTGDHPVIQWFDVLKEDDFITEPYWYDGSYSLTASERDLVERIVMHEAGWCPDYRILILTAQCIRNACEIHDWRPDEVYKKCGYAAMKYSNPRCQKAVAEVFDIGIKCVDEQIHSYYNRNLVSSPYHESFVLAIDIDGNRFFYG